MIKPIRLLKFIFGIVATFLIQFFANEASAQLSVEYKAVMPGLDYAHYTETNHPWSIHIARIDRHHKELELMATHAQGHIAALGTVASQIAEVKPGQGKPVLGVNADFFVIAKGSYQGDPMGLQIINGELSSAASGATFWVEVDGSCHVGKVESQLTLKTRHTAQLPIGLNESRKDNQAVLYTPAFATSTHTTNGMELVLEAIPGKPWLPLEAGKQYSARVREVRTAPNTPLTPETMVISCSPQLAPKFSGIAVGAPVEISTGSKPDVSHAVQAVGGRPVLIENGKIPKLPPDQFKSTNAPGTLVTIRNPRTAIGFNKDYLYLMVVDGRQKTLSMGMTFAETALFMQDLGCTDAINLDGGGSTTFWLDGKVLNSPSDKHERTVANCLILVKH